MSQFYKKTDIHISYCVIQIPAISILSGSAYRYMHKLLNL